MAQDERGYLIVPHEVATGADCDGCLIIEERGDVAYLKCNSCGVVVDTVPIGRAGQRLMELASDEICCEWCPHCGTLNTFPGFSAIKAFICRKCGEEVNVERPASDSFSLRAAAQEQADQGPGQRGARSTNTSRPRGARNPRRRIVEPLG